MTASSPTVDRRPVPKVAIIGNDAVLSAAPATPVQLAHACLRRGFTVAVPASWGDELIAAESVRRLASRERGPAVMCVCPFARSRLLAPGPDLEPFLVSLVSPPVATARYLRAVYGEHGVHITYIGGCPSAEDGSIDARLTPNAFLADLAEQGIALSEQPLVFDSIVPPDRRRWCSLPGGAPTAEILWADSDTRTLIEIDREDVSTDLAQHIITHEHVLLDLAPGLGCVCSGAIGSVPARSARGAVTVLEPPRSHKPIIDPTPLVSLDVPVAEQAAPVPLTGQLPIASQRVASRGDPLDEVVGGPSAELALEIDVEVALRTSGSSADDASTRPTDTEAPATVESTETLAVAGPAPTDETTATSWPAAPKATAAPRAEPPASESEPDTVPGSITAVNAAPSLVRRRTPAPMPARHPASAIPRATASDGRALPRAYVAKRRTPSAGVPLVDEDPHAMGAAGESPENRGDAPPPADIETSPAVTEQPAVEAPTGDEPPPVASPATTAEEEKPAATAERSEPSKASPSATGSDAAAVPRGVDKQPRGNAKPAGGAVTATDSNSSALVVLLVALIALGFFVFRALN